MFVCNICFCTFIPTLIVSFNLFKLKYKNKSSPRRLKKCKKKPFEICLRLSMCVPKEFLKSMLRLRCIIDFFDPIDNFIQSRLHSTDIKRQKHQSKNVYCNKVLLPPNNFYIVHKYTTNDKETHGAAAALGLNNHRTRSLYWN